jgi:hypothetical protein
MLSISFVSVTNLSQKAGNIKSKIIAVLRELFIQKVKNYILAFHATQDEVLFLSELSLKGIIKNSYLEAAQCFQQFYNSIFCLLLKPAKK